MDTCYMLMVFQLLLIHVSKANKYSGQIFASYPFEIMQANNSAGYAQSIENSRKNPCNYIPLLYPHSFELILCSVIFKQSSSQLMSILQMSLDQKPYRRSQKFQVAPSASSVSILHPRYMLFDLLKNSTTTVIYSRRPSPHAFTSSNK